MLRTVKSTSMMVELFPSSNDSELCKVNHSLSWHMECSHSSAFRSLGMPIQCFSRGDTILLSSTLLQQGVIHQRRGFEPPPLVHAMSLNIGDLAPGFDLKNANASEGPAQMTLEQSRKSKGLIVVFECNHCPYVIASISRLEAMSAEAESNDIGFVGINSNDPVMYPNDSYEHMVKRAENMSYPYLHDDSQEIARAYDAKRTPEFFLFDEHLKLVYKGRMDDSPRDPTQAQTHELHDAIQAMLHGQAPEITQTESIGCSVKWKQ